MFRWGEVIAVVTSGSISSFIDSVNHHDISLTEIRFIDDLNIRIKFKLSDYKTLRRITKKRGDELRLLHTYGGRFVAVKLLKRPVLLISFLIWLFLVLFLPSRILFFQVEGNKEISEYEILSAAQKCGVHFGTSRRYVKSEKVKNGMISQIDRLKWVGVNTKGCVATISVKEGAVPENKGNHHNFGNLVATIDGVISEMIVTSGNPLCKVGQAVQKGQILVSGYTDCGLHVKRNEVKGEIYGITRRDVSAVAISPDAIRGEAVSIKTNYGIQIGKNIIKLKNYSGILGDGCVKMYERRNVTLPGGFSLPISIVKETIVEYKLAENSSLDESSFAWVKEAANDLCTDDMVAGEILYSATDGSLKDTGYFYSGYYICKEMISKVRTEELFDNYGKRNRQNR